MTEDLLHFAWKFRLFGTAELFSIGKMPLSIIRTGEHNTHAGPDFLNGRVRIGDTEWAGNIEIHKRSSEWFSHGHQHDPAYDNVILHVVYEHDREVYNSKKQSIPTLELKHYIAKELLERYEHLYKNKQEIPCGKQFSEAPELVRNAWLERMLIERLEEKTRFIKELYDYTGSNWEETFYLLLCKNFGFKVNSECFLQLGKSVPLEILLRQSGSLVKNEALLFGQAGLLNEDFTEEYPASLIKEYLFLQAKYRLLSPVPHNWKFLRMRPRNFPTIRIAQMAAFISNYQHTFSKILETEDLIPVKNMFGVSASGYWKTHYVFGKPVPSTEKPLGDASIENILINTVCPILFFYGKIRNEENLCEKALKWYSELSSEENSVISLYGNLGFRAGNAAHSQALLQLNQNYCKTKKCLRCSIGNYILKPQTAVNKLA
jgi:hypothetical protein